MSVVTEDWQSSVIDWNEVPDEYLQETVLERIEGLKEMFPEKFRNYTWSIAQNGWWATRGALAFSRQALWVVSTTAIFILAPYLVEKELDDEIKFQAKSQQKLLLGHAPTMPHK